MSASLCSSLAPDLLSSGRPSDDCKKKEMMLKTFALASVESSLLFWPIALWKQFSVQNISNLSWNKSSYAHILNVWNLFACQLSVFSFIYVLLPIFPRLLTYMSTSISLHPLKIFPWVSFNISPVCSLKASIYAWSLHHWLDKAIRSGDTACTTRNSAVPIQYRITQMRV